MLTNWRKLAVPMGMLDLGLFSYLDLSSKFYKNLLSFGVAQVPKSAASWLPRRVKSYAFMYSFNAFRA